MAASSASSGQAWPLHNVIVRQNGSVSVEWSDCDLEDEALLTFVNERLSTLLSKLPNTGTEITVNLSGNCLSGAEPLRKLLRCLREAGVHVTVLRLHKNRFTDEAAAALAEHIIGAVAAKKPLMQLHLSNNALTEVGIRQLIEATYMSHGYPRPNAAPPLPSLGCDCNRRALWLRTEQQQPPMQDPRGFLRQLANEGLDVVFFNSNDARFPPETVVHMHPSFLGNMPKGKDAAGWYHDGKGGFKGKGPLGEPKGKRFEAKGEGKGYTYGKRVDHADGVNGKGRHTGPRDEMDDHNWLRLMRDQHPGCEALWRQWCKTKLTQAMPKELRLKSVSEFVDYYRRGDGVAELEAAIFDVAVSEDDFVRGWGADGGPQAPPAASPTATTQGSSRTPGFPNSSVQCAAPPGISDTGPGWRTWLLRNSTLLPQLRKAAAAGALFKSLQPATDARSEYQRLVYVGNQALRQGCGRKAFDVGASFLGEEALRELSEAALSRATLNSIAQDLNLRQFLDFSCEHVEDSAVFLALFGELQERPPGESEGISAAKQSAAKALLDYAFMAGISHRAEQSASPTPDDTPSAPSAASAAAVSAAAAAAVAVAEEEGASGGAYDLGSLAASFGLSFDTAGKGIADSRGLFAEPQGQSFQAERSIAGGEQLVPPYAYKKKRCVFWEQGRCTKGSVCTFAHGEADLAPSRGNACSPCDRPAPPPHFGPSWEAGPTR